MRMKMPFHEWFYRTHAYLQNSGKDGFVDYNDTKQVPMSDRFNKLVELESDLFTEQPYGVIANRRGFNKLIDLLETSNYTFEDINDSLIDAYQHSLTNAMSRMLVNTHAVMFKCKNTDKRYVSSDRLSRYYIVDAPFNQLHFGDRDEFIRQQLQKMHTEENDLYIPLTDFVTSPYTDLLGFTLMICVNGKICNDCMVAIDDKGFKFKINWPYDYKECYFVIYKLDSSKVYVTETTYDDLVNDTSKIVGNFPNANNECCIVNLYDNRYSKTVPTVPNFGILTPDGLRLMNLQDKTMVDFERQRTNEITVVIYALKYFHEVPNLYPAVNYYDIIDRRRIYDETGERVVEGDKNTYAYGSSTTEINNLEICTPPIVLDRNATTSFSTIVNCLKLRDDMIVNYDPIKRIGTRLISGNVTETELNGLKDTMRSIETSMKRCHKTYIEGALLTSLVDSDRIDSFGKFMTNVNNFITLATVSNLSQYTDYNVFPQLYNTGFVTFVDYIVKPFKDNALTPFEDIIDQYPTDMNYEPSNASSLNWKDYSEISDEAPFAVNFLFYTINMMNGNEDKLQAYFYRQLIKRMHSPRYADIDISQSIDRSFMLPVNYSRLTISPTRVDKTSSDIPTSNGIYGFYGIPFITNNSGDVITNTPYRYTFNVYENETKYPMIVDNDYTMDGFISYDDVVSFNAVTLNYHNDIYIARLVTRYLIACYDAISYLQTWYKHPIDTTLDTSTFIQYIESTINDINSYFNKFRNQFINPTTSQVCERIINSPLIEKLEEIVDKLKTIHSINFNGRIRRINDVANDFIKTLQSVHKNTGFDDGVSKRIEKLYDHFKKINTLQSMYDFFKWVDNIDIEMIDELDNMRSENENGVYVGSNVFQPYSTAFHTYISSVDIVDELISMINNLYDEYYSSHFKPIIEYCEDIIENWIMDFYILDDIIYDKSETYSTKPYIITVDVTSSDRFHPRKGQIIDVNSTLIFEPIIEKVGNSWIINNISKIVEYAFFVGTDYQITMNVLSESGSVISSINGTMKFFRISSSADDMIAFNQYPYMKNACIDIQNVHEEFEIINNKDILNKKFGKMNYELLVGNSYCQLDHMSELILERKSMLQGSVDRIYLPGFLLNKLSNHEFGQHESFGVYFKPSQVLHIPIVNDVMTSVGGKYFVGQTLYLVTDDHKYIFPIVVTSIDMGESSGFVEAEVDQFRSKWFKIDNIDEIKRYMTTNISCTVIDDNISNFLDEYTDSRYDVYQIPEFPTMLDPSDEDNVNAYSMPGDPVYVTMNAPYVYTRLNWMFNHDVDNRFMDDHPQNHHMVYVGYTDSLDETSPICVRLINHSFEPFTDPEKYPILRTEPDDHNIWSEELKVFNIEYRKAQGEYASIEKSINQAWEAWAHVQDKTIEAWKMFQITIQDMESKAGMVLAKTSRIKSYIDQLEYPTTWYNVRTYETAHVYINNGRAPRNYGRIVNVRNIPYTEKLDVWIYDWENHCWIDHALYDISLDKISSVKIGEYENYNTSNVMNNITINPHDGFPSSRKIIIYLSYDKSDVFDTIPINPTTCDVRFKPLLTLDSTITDYDPYSKINIRKHFDGHEKYMFEEFSDIPNFSKNGYLFNRPTISGKRVGTPNIRFIDMIASDSNGVISNSNLDVYVKIPYKDTYSTDKLIKQTYDANIVLDIDNFIPDTIIKLICINGNQSSYNGNVSSIMFEALTSVVDGEKRLTIINSTLPTWVNGVYTCTVFQDNAYSASGGIVTIAITLDEVDVVDGNWVKVLNPEYRILPDEFVIVPNVEISGNVIFDFNNRYIKNSESSIDDHCFYYNTNENIRYPIGDVRKNSHSQRLIIDKSLNPDINIVKTTYLSVCRYAIQKIPSDGIIDMTGYLPTPLSRNHYEFWVNGRCINDPSNLKILSPTSIQLINLKSLRNFECIELVDDFDDTLLSPKCALYVDLNGYMYTSHNIAQGRNIHAGGIKYQFNSNNQQPIHTYTKSIISNPNNKNIERDILDTVDIQSDTTRYDELFNIPSINGVDIYNPKSYHLGLVETPNDKILEMFDTIWRREQCTNSLFPMTHIVDSDNTLLMHSRYSPKDESYILYATGSRGYDGFFTLYISKSPSGKIDDSTNTVKILPFIRSGVFVYVDKSYMGLWLHCTLPNISPIKIL